MAQGVLCPRQEARLRAHLPQCVGPHRAHAPRRQVTQPLAHALQAGERALGDLFAQVLIVGEPFAQAHHLFVAVDDLHRAAVHAGDEQVKGIGAEIDGGELAAVAEARRQLGGAGLRRLPARRRARRVAGVCRGGRLRRSLPSPAGGTAGGVGRGSIAACCRPGRMDVKRGGAKRRPPRLLGAGSAPVGESGYSAPRQRGRVRSCSCGAGRNAVSRSRSRSRSRFRRGRTAGGRWASGQLVSVVFERLLRRSL